MDTVVAMPQAGPLTEDEAATIAYVRDLQRDGRLLLRHVARRADRSLAMSPGIAAVPQITVLTEDPAAIARDRGKFQALTGCVDALSRQAAPANASTIRLTRAYLRSATEGGEPSVEVKARVRWLRAVIFSLIVLVVLAVIVSIGLLAHVDNGRRAVQQLQASVAEIETLQGELAKLPPNAWVPPRVPALELTYRPMCPGSSAYALLPADTPDGARADALCSLLGQAALRNRLVMMRLARWNSLSCGVPLLDPCTPPDAGETMYDQSMQHHWDRTELRTASVISTLTGFVLPLLMGFIGGAAYVLRRLDHKLSENTLEVRDGWHAVLRVLLATMLGGLLGVVWSGDEPVQLGGFALTLAAAAFFVGFALEAVFTVIEAMVEGVAGRLQTPPPPQVITAPPMIVPQMPMGVPGQS
ncbi:hypothetical protein [Roseomonas sp. AR75]|jgi:hypothetical protein|uniref:hypothetical protein n=1 Tax=Roseomonas sp. AR75 TaxID=2562311 RepID=UPI0010C0EFF0|nr:hypothetical protein [Roseomonas sp. AR75]